MRGKNYVNIIKNPHFYLSQTEVWQNKKLNYENN